MKIIKKIAAFTIAVALTASSLPTDVFAQAAEPDVKVFLKADKGNIGDIITVSVVEDGTKKICGTQFKLKFNPIELQYQEKTAKAGEAVMTLVLNVNDREAANGVISFGGVKAGDGIALSNSVILTASFKVLKAGAKLSLVDVICIDDTFDGNKYPNLDVKGITVEDKPIEATTTTTKPEETTTTTKPEETTTTTKPEETTTTTKPEEVTTTTKPGEVTTTTKPGETTTTTTKASPDNASSDQSSDVQSASNTADSNSENKGNANTGSSSIAAIAIATVVTFTVVALFKKRR